MGGAFRVTQGLIEQFGERRVIDTPISETAMVGAGIGLAASGWRPIIELQFADFISCAYDQLVTEAAKAHYRFGIAVPMVVRAPSGAGVGAGPFHSQSPEGTFAHVPGLKVVCPGIPAGCVRPPPGRRARSRTRSCTSSTRRCTARCAPRSSGARLWNHWDVARFAAEVEMSPW